MRIIKFMVVAFIAMVGLTILLPAIFGSGTVEDPLIPINRALATVPTYSVILSDMDTQGNFFKTYRHKYKIMFDKEITLDGKKNPADTPKALKQVFELDKVDLGGDQTRLGLEVDTQWLPVPESRFKDQSPYLGMVVFAKKDNKYDASVGPPGYNMVGDSRYGRWRNDSSGRSFWEFYGQYALISHLLGGSPIYRSDYNNYTNYRSQGRPYYGSQSQYGTMGSTTRQQKPGFYSRKMSQEMVKSSSFKDRVNQKIGRTRVSSRGRSGRVGK